MSDFALFFGKFLRHGTAIASLAPSSPWLSRAVVRGIDWDRAATVIELGAGTGPISLEIARNAPPCCRVVLLERDPDFHERLKARFGHLPRFEVLRGDVRDLTAILGDRGIEQVDHVVSGLPVPSFPRDLQRSLFDAVGRFLRPDGTYRQITEIPWLYRNLYRRHFESVRFHFEPRNFPPAGWYECRGLKANLDA